MSEKDGGPACPETAGSRGGMSLRDYFAAQALTGLVTAVELPPSDQAAAAYKIADAMLKARAA